MGRQNYMTISVADTIQDIFNEYVATKGITKIAARNDVLEIFSDKMSVSFPSKGYTIEFGENERAKIWIK